MQNIDKALQSTVRNSNLENVTINITEVITDSFLDSGILKDLPVISTFVGLGKTAISIKDKLFLKKVICFLEGLKDIPIQKRQKMIDLIDLNEEKQIKVGEKLIYILDKCDDHIDSKYIAQFFCGYLEEKITYEDFLEGARIIQNVYIKDLEYFLRTELVKIEEEASIEEAPDEITFPLINCGICGFGYNPVRVEDPEEYGTERYVVRGGEAVIWVTTIGHKLKNNLTIQ